MIPKANRKPYTLKKENHCTSLSSEKDYLKTQGRCVQGGALYYAIFVMLLFSGMGILLLTFFQLTFREDTLFYQSAKLDDNLISAINLISSEPNLVSPGEEKVIDLFQDGNELVTVSCNRWGMMRKIIAEASWRRLVKNSVVLMAEKEKERVALYMPDKKKYVSLVGKSYVKGTCYLSELGLRKGNAEGRYFEGSTLFEGELKISGSNVPALKSELVNYLTSYLSGNFSSHDSVISYHPLKSKDVMIQPYSDKTLLIQSPQKMVLSEGIYSDNIIIYCADTIEVWPTVSLNDVLLFAPVIVIKNGFDGKTQAFSSQKMVLGNGCHFKYPSFLGVVSNNKGSEMIIGNECQINGAAFTYCYQYEEGCISINCGSNIKLIGKLYTNGDVTGSGQIWGGLHCDRLVYKTPRAFYENFMIDLAIDESKLDNQYASFCITDDVYELKTIRQCQ